MKALTPTRTVRLHVSRQPRRWDADMLARRTLFGCALMTIVSVLLIIYFIFQAGVPFLWREGILDFVFGPTWYPRLGQYGIWPMIVGTLAVTAGAILIGVPLGLLVAVCLAEYAPRAVAAVARPAIELLAGIPSVVYGFYGLIVLVPIIRQLFGGTGFGVITASLVIGIMILPTIISVAQDAIKSVPEEYRAGALALGAGKWQTVRSITLPAASSGILAGVVLGIGRAIGETMAVIMVIGGAAQVPRALTDMARTLTANVALEMGYAAGEHREALFATGVILFIFIILLNLSLQLIRRRRCA